MTKSDDEKNIKATEDIQELKLTLSQSLPLLRLAGYGLLILAFFNLMKVFIPPSFGNPSWELQTMGVLVEGSPILLLGLVTVFAGERSWRSKWEFPILEFLSWLVFLLAVLFFLIIPWGIFNAVTINNQNNEQIQTQIEQRMSQTQQVREQLSKVTTAEEMKTLIARLDNQGRAPDIENTQQLEETKQRLASFLDQMEQSIEAEATKTRSNQRLILLKNSLAWNLGALVSGVIFLIIWRTTNWAR